MAAATRLPSSADERELAQDRDQRGGKSLEAEVGEPEAKVELIGHEDSLQGLSDAEMNGVLWRECE